MKIRIQSNGVALGGNNRRLGNIISQPLSQFSTTRNIHLEIELPNFHCNVGGTDPTTGQFACLFCPRNLKSFQPEPDRVEEICRAIKAQLDQVSILRIGGVAEPFWQDRIFEILDQLELNSDSAPKVFTTTNGTLLGESQRQRWFDTVGQSEISFSLDATCPKTYFQLRRIAEYDRVVENMDQYCRTRNPDQHVAVLRNHINLLNIEEVEAMVQMTKDHFLHFLALSLTVPHAKELKKYCLNKENRQRFVEARRRAQSLANGIGVNVVFADDWPE